MAEEIVSRTGSDSNDRACESSSARLLRDVEDISRALYLHKPPPKALISASHVRSKYADKSRFPESKSNQSQGDLGNMKHKHKKSSLLWNWKKPLKALTHIGHICYDICFFLHVHSIEGLPVNFNHLSLCMQWKRKNQVSCTRASKVLDGVAEFEETLKHRCFVYGSRSGSQNSAKYEEKLFLIYGSVVGAPGLDIGKHWVDLTRLLPLSFEELEGDNSSGKWTTSFKLAGKAKGATLNVSFGFFLAKDNLLESRDKLDGPSQVKHSGGLSNDDGMFHHIGSISSNLNLRSLLSSPSVDINLTNDVLPHLGMELSNSISFLYQKLNEGNLHGSPRLDKSSEYAEQPNTISDDNFELDKGTNECGDTEFSVTEQWVEMCQKDQFQLEENAIDTVDGSIIETINVDEILKDCEAEVDEESKQGSEVDHCSSYLEESSTCSNLSTVEVVDSSFHNLLISELTDLESPPALSDFLVQEEYMEVKSNYKAGKVPKKLLSLDDIAESVATDFLNMLEIERGQFGPACGSAPESPRERLLREFENDALASGNFILDSDAVGEELSTMTPSCSADDISEDSIFSSVISDIEQHKMERQLLKDRRKVKMLEDLETEALMLEWGLDEKAFQSSPRICSDGFGSPIELPSEESVELPPLGDGVGHLIQIKSGGYLRSMNPLLFRNCKNVGHLIIQVSRPVLFPARLGSNIMELVQNLASLGIENLSLQVNTLMPLEDITGKTIQQVAQEVEPTAMVPERQRQVKMQCESLFELDSFAERKEVEGFQFDWEYDHLNSDMIGGDYVPLGNLAPLTLSQIEALAIEGLKIQSGMSDVDAPSSVSTSSAGKVSGFAGKASNCGEFLCSEPASGLSFPDADDTTFSVDRLMGLSIPLDEWLKLDAGIIADEDQISEHMIQILAAHNSKGIDLVSGTLTKHKKCGKASVKLHGLLGDNITVALRVLLRDPLRNYEPVGNSMLALIQLERASVAIEQEQDWEEKDDSVVSQEKEQGSPLFKIIKVNLAGLDTKPDKKLLWGTRTQQQSGTRWLLASGMAKSKKQSFTMSSAIVGSNPSVIRKLQDRDVLWSLTYNIHNSRTNWIRNPNVIFPNESVSVS
ncbi:hypothetical protein SLEP1_g12842 [Rubroshorea leprosula]|uniref:C2 NT-type domain-containing protein n=1 Tax=Rubroshorea leprosula TaxID=152421 RepID=A0AAV5IJL3_9ROSI|nr:hypothetical protein SLEP1_g12842 [Rubroshorea leprosula]